MKYPEMLKTNARYRGPMESNKQNNAMRDIAASTAQIRAELEARKEAARALMGNMMNEYTVVIPGRRRTIAGGIRYLRGGETK